MAAAVTTRKVLISALCAGALILLAAPAARAQDIARNSVFGGTNGAALGGAMYGAIGAGIGAGLGMGVGALWAWRARGFNKRFALEEYVTRPEDGGYGAYWGTERGGYAYLVPPGYARPAFGSAPPPVPSGRSLGPTVTPGGYYQTPKPPGPSQP